MRITVEMVVAERPCSDYPVERVTDLWGGRESLTPSEVAALDIPINDRGWLLGRMLGHFDPTRVVARRIARDALGDLKIPESYQAWLDTGDEALRAAARAAAWDAAWEAARAAAWDAARDAAWDAARAAAWDAARAAAWDAARDAARAAAWDAARDASWDAARDAARDAAWDAAREAARAAAWGAAREAASEASRAAARAAAWEKYIGWMVEFLEGK